jgi:glycosyltransferase involved in cell wall biosynthesis
VGRLLYVQYTNPAAYPPLQHSSRIMARNGWEVLFLGTGAVGAGGLSFPAHQRIHVRCLRFSVSGWRQWLSYPLFCLWVLGWMLHWRPSRVYVSDYLACPIGLLLTFIPGVQVIYHEHDSPAPADGDARRQICLRTRRWLAHRATVCVLPNHARAARFASQVGGAPNILCVWNCPSQDEVTPLRPRSDDPTLWVHFHGSIVPARLPPSVLSALAKLPDNVKLRVIGYETVGHAGYVNRLKAAACQLGLDDRIEFVGPTSRQELLQWARRSHVGLCFIPKVAASVDDAAMVGASNKPFDYLANGMPLVVTDLAEWRSVYVTPGYARACDPDDPDAIAAALQWFVAHPVERWAMGERGRKRILDDWNYERQFAPVCEQLGGPRVTSFADA